MLRDNAGFVGPGRADGYTVVLARSGGYLRRIAGEEFFVDASGGYLTRPGDEHRVAHPIGSGDRSTEIRLGAALFSDRFDGPSLSRRFTVTGTTDVHHRALLAAARRGADDFELAERLPRLLDDVAASAGRPVDLVERGGQPGPIDCGSDSTRGSTVTSSQHRRCLRTSAVAGCLSGQPLSARGERITQCLCLSPMI